MSIEEFEGIASKALGRAVHRWYEIPVILDVAGIDLLNDSADEMTDKILIWGAGE
jgi:hypothetical protein